MLKKRLNELSRLDVLANSNKLEIISEEQALNVVGGCSFFGSCTTYTGDCGTFGECTSYTRKQNLEEA